eukprot:1577468-Rhodomonas_salina.3
MVTPKFLKFGGSAGNPATGLPVAFPMCWYQPVLGKMVGLVPSRRNPSRTEPRKVVKTTAYIENTIIINTITCRPERDMSTCLHQEDKEKKREKEEKRRGADVEELRSGAEESLEHGA